MVFCKATLPFIFLEVCLFDTYILCISIMGMAILTFQKSSKYMENLRKSGTYPYPTLAPSLSKIVLS